MKNITLIVLSLLLAISSFAEVKDSDLFPSNVPNRVKYTRPKKNDAEAARALLIKVFSSNEEAKLFGDVAAIYPPLWQEIKDIKPYSEDPGGIMTTFCDGKKMDGKALKSDASKTTLVKYLQSKFPQKEKTKIRPPDYNDLQKYWSIIAWDLESPLFVVENDTSKYIFEFQDGTVFTIFDLNSMNL